MKLVDKEITLDELKSMAAKMFGEIVKAVIDIEKNVIAIDFAMHVDGEVLLLEHGSKPEHIWSINIFPELVGTEQFISFNSVMNIRAGNKSCDVNDPVIKKQIKNIVNRFVI